MFEDKLFKQKMKHSFDLAKRDIYALYEHIAWLSQRMETLEAKNQTLAHALEAVKGELDECCADCC